jgi:predicted house-cleaning noncanonical NTP pyrophosphatase (MazG superfamily)
MKVYNKLVRDRIPEIISASGKHCEVQIIEDNNQVIELLEKKLLEELNEYQVDRNIEEIADMVEVLFSLGERLGTKREELLRIVIGKSRERGGFNQGVFLVSVTE